MRYPGFSLTLGTQTEMLEPNISVRWIVAGVQSHKVSKTGEAVSLVEMASRFGLDGLVRGHRAMALECPVTTPSPGVPGF